MIPLISESLLQINFLGSFKIKTDAGDFTCADWKSKKALTLFKYLASRRGKSVNSDILIELLWPESDVDKTHNLHTTIYYLRKILKSFLNLEKDISFIKHSKGLYWFEKDENCWIDCEEFEKNYKNGKRSEESNPGGALKYYKDALPLYRGEFLLDDRYEDWTLELRQYYFELYIEMTLKVAKLEVELNQNYDEAIHICQRAMEFDPFREQLYQQIMNYQMEDGRFVEVAKTYKKYKEMLSEEFGLDPSPQAQKLYEELKNTDESPFNLMEENNRKHGAFICNSQTFKTLYELQLRQQERHGESFALMDININNKNNGNNDSILKLLSNSLRHGDVICQWDEDNICIQLFFVEEKIVDLVKRRIEAIFKELSWDVSFNYSLLEPSGIKIKLEEMLG